MKRLSIGIGILASILLAGCAKTEVSTISFDTFTTTIKVPNIYKQTKVNSQNTNIKKVYSTSASGFQASIIIGTETIMSGDSIAFANTNLKTLRENLTNKGTITKSKNIQLSCGKIDIPASLSSIEVQQGVKTRYVSQMYFVHEYKGYIISHITEDKNEVKGIQKGLKKIKCATK